MEADELWTFAGNKENYAWGKKDIAAVRELEVRLNALKVIYGGITMDKWQGFVEIFGSEKSNLGKKHTVGMEGNNCRLRHRIRWLVMFFKEITLPLQNF